MASQEDYIGGTPAFPEESPPIARSFEQTHACRLLAFDLTDRSGPPPEDYLLAHGAAVTFGRNRDCSVQLADSYVSGLHCRIWHDLKDNELWIKDYSSNGTFIDGRKIGKGNTTTLVNKNKITFSRPQIGYTVESYVDKKEEGQLADRYDFRGELGRGAFSVVKKAISVRDGRVCAIKIINKAKLLGDPKSREQVTREIEILKSVQHPNIVQYIDYVDTGSKMYIVLEFADGGELFDHIVENGAFAEDEAKRIFIQLLNGVVYLHSQGIAHRDLKPENILVHRNTIKITDFGLAKLSENKSFMKTLCGTPQYVAPEIIRMASQNDDGAQGYTTAVDMWSLGVILFLLLTGRQPFTQDNGRTMSLYSQIENVDYSYPPPEDGIFVPESAKDLITKLLQLEPSHRLTAMQALRHPWLADAVKDQIGREVVTEASASKGPGAASSSSTSGAAAASITPQHHALPPHQHPHGNIPPQNGATPHPPYDPLMESDAGGLVTPHVPSGANGGGWNSLPSRGVHGAHEAVGGGANLMDTDEVQGQQGEVPQTGADDPSSSSSHPSAASRKRYWSSMDDSPAPKATGGGPPSLNPKSSVNPKNNAASAHPPSFSPPFSNQQQRQAASSSAATSSAMDMDPSAPGQESPAVATSGAFAAPAPPSSDGHQYLQYGSSATYIESTSKRRKLMDGQPQQ